MLQTKQLAIFCLLAAFLWGAGGMVYCQEAEETPSESATPAENKPSSENKTDDTTQESEPQLEVDDRIKVKISPLVIGPVIDRVTESAIVTVHAPGASRVEVYVEPVDAPYGGRKIGEPRLLGRSADLRGFTVTWSKPESDRYVRLYAIAYRLQSQPTRSRGTDLGIGGRRLVITPVDAKPEPGAR